MTLGDQIVAFRSDPRAGVGGSGTGTNGEISLIEDVRLDGLRFLLDQWLNSPNVPNFVGAFLRQLQEAEGRILEILDEALNLDAASGTQLDRLGELVLDARSGRSDANYRRSLRVQILINSSDARADQILEIVRLYEGLETGGDVRLYERAPKSVVIEIKPAASDPLGVALRLRQARGAASNAQLLYHGTPDSFKFDEGMGSVYTPGSGPPLSGAFDVLTFTTPVVSPVTDDVLVTTSGDMLVTTLGDTIITTD